MARKQNEKNKKAVDSGERTATTSLSLSKKISRFDIKDLTPTEKMEYLRRRKIMPTRFPDMPTEMDLKIDEDVTDLIARIGWTSFFMIEEPTYEDITLEFLSTLKLLQRGSLYFMTFTLEGRAHTLSVNELADMFGIPRGGARYESDCPDFDFKKLWKSISVDKTDPLGLLAAAEAAADPLAKPRNEYHPSKSAVSSIFHPAFRYIHRCLAGTMFARGDNVGKFQLHDMLALCGMLKHEPVDGAYHLAFHLQSQANAVLENILVGGLITHIAKSLGVTFHDTIPLHQIQRVDTRYLIFVKMIQRGIVKSDGPIYLRLNEAPFCPLPLYPSLPVSSKHNWKPLHLIQSYISEGVLPQQGYSVPSTSQAPLPSPERKDIPVDNFAEHVHVDTTLDKRLEVLEKNQREILNNQAPMEAKLDQLVARLQKKEKKDKKFKKKILSLMKKGPKFSESEVGEDIFGNQGFEKFGIMEPLEAGQQSHEEATTCIDGLGMPFTPTLANAHDQAAEENADVGKEAEKETTESLKAPIAVPIEPVMEKGSSSKKGEKNFMWSNRREKFLISFLAECAKSGEKHGKSFRKSVYTKAANGVTDAFSEVCTSMNVDSRMKTVKKRYANIKKLRERSGWGWDDEQKMIIVDKAEALAFIEENSYAKDLLNVPIDQYEELKIVCGKDQATGSFARSEYKTSLLICQEALKFAQEELKSKTVVVPKSEPVEDSYSGPPGFGPRSFREE